MGASLPATRLYEKPDLNGSIGSLMEPFCPIWGVLTKRNKSYAKGQFGIIDVAAKATEKWGIDSILT